MIENIEKNARYNKFRFENNKTMMARFKLGGLF